ncbi:MAG: hypothetical protein R3190_08450 [Thermoanaerobaculia bacterium]|nr:hypothetical protein [Thermoanaerobaculia bacterium]
MYIASKIYLSSAPRTLAAAALCELRAALRAVLAHLVANEIA